MFLLKILAFVCIQNAWTLSLSPFMKESDMMAKTTINQTISYTREYVHVLDGFYANTSDKRMRGTCRHPTCCRAWVSLAPCLSCGLCACAPCLCACLYVCGCLRNKGEIKLFCSINRNLNKTYFCQLYLAFT